MQRRYVNLVHRIESYLRHRRSPNLWFLYDNVHRRLVLISLKYDVLEPVYEYLVKMRSGRDVICWYLMDIGFWLQYGRNEGIDVPAEDVVIPYRPRWVSWIGDKLFWWGFRPHKWLRSD